MPEKAHSELELPAEDPINDAKEIFSPISATVVPNPNDRSKAGQGGQPDGLLGSIRSVGPGKSMWAKVKEDPLFYALR